MELQTVLHAAINSMIYGHHKPHCYHAHVPGLGYVNDGNMLFHRADYLKQLERSAKSEVENMNFAPDYAEPGYHKPKQGILFADWNCFPTNLDTILERLGFAVEWSDEWSTCNNCNKAFRTSPDSYCWKPAYKEIDGDILCLDCAKEEE